MDILLVDNSGERKAISRFLSDQGHRVRECATGEDAIVFFNSGPYDLILSSLSLPKMTGLTLLQRVKLHKRGQEIPVVMMAGDDEGSKAIEALEQGARDYIFKPVNLKELQIVLAKIFEHVVLKKQFTHLHRNFDDKLSEATQGIATQLDELKKSYLDAVGISRIGLFGESMKNLEKVALKLHDHPKMPVLIEGENGTGKEIFARIIHYGSGNPSGPLMEMPCSIAPEHFENELFGYAGGAFAGALPEGKKGRLEMAQGGTIFFDEIGHLPLDTQAVILRVIQERTFYRTGGTDKKVADVRFVFATNRDLVPMIEAGTFRKDLYYRINVGYIHIPPLRERPEEILPLAQMFLVQSAEENNLKFKEIDPRAEKILQDHPWEGNVRELKNAIERVALLHNEEKILPEHLNFLKSNNHTIHQTDSLPNTQNITGTMDHCINPYSFELPKEGFSLDDFISDIVAKALELHGGNKTITSQYLGISRHVLRTKIKNLDD